MEKKEEKRRKILPPIEEFLSTPDLVNEALRKVIPPSPFEGKKEKSEIIKSRPQDVIEPKEKKPEVEKKLKKKSGAQSQYNSVTSELGHDDRAIIEPSHIETQSQYDPATIYPSKNYLIIPHFLLDEVFPTLNAYEQILLLRLYRLSYGFRRNVTDPVGKKTLADKCNMSIGMVKKVIKSVEEKRLISTIPDKSNDPRKGNRYNVLTRLQDNPVLNKLSHNKPQSQHDPKKLNIDDEYIKNKHHQKEKSKNDDVKLSLPKNSHFEENWLKNYISKFPHVEKEKIKRLAEQFDHFMLTAGKKKEWVKNPTGTFIGLVRGEINVPIDKQAPTFEDRVEEERRIEEEEKIRDKERLEWEREREEQEQRKGEIEKEIREAISQLSDEDLGRFVKGARKKYGFKALERDESILERVPYFIIDELYERGEEDWKRIWKEIDKSG
jgi:hypothetical protein